MMKKSFTTLGSKARCRAGSWAALACLALLLLISGSSQLQAQTTATKPKPKADAAASKDAGTAGKSIKVGQKFPSLKLKDQNGKAFDLTKTLKDGPVALVIFRSADW
jgi:cytochrome oxidase Cu insertion factor (SCO1/SenC/PrrC family)